MATIKSEYYRFNGVSWDLHYFKTTIDQVVGAKEYIASRGQNLLSNGAALLGDNTNFSAFTFDGSQAYYSGGSFRYKRPDNGGQVASTDEFMPVNPDLRYKLEMFAKTLNATGRYYAMIMCYDVDGLDIAANHHMFRPNTLTSLAQDLKPGDTTVYLNSAANWDNSGTAGVSTHLRSFIFWNYVNSKGFAYPELTYSRNWYGNMWDPGAINFTNNTITLRTAWTGPTIPAGTKLSNGSSGGTFKYIALGYTLIPSVWTYYSGIMSGVDLSGTNAGGKFPPGTAKAKVGWLMDYNVAGDTAWFANLSFGIDYNYSAETLKTPRQINGVNFDGSANITIYDNTKLPLAGGTLTGPLYLTDAKTKVEQGSASGDLKITTPTGYIGIGSLNTGWTHFNAQTGRPFYFNQEGRFAGNLGLYNKETYLEYANGYIYELSQRVYSPNNKPSWDDIQTKPIALTDTNQKIEMGGTTQYIRLAYGGKSQAFIKHSGGVEYEVYTQGSDVISAITSLAAPTIFTNTISSDGGSIAFSGGLDYINFSDVTIINVPDPTASHHPATKDYVDKFAAPVATKTASATLALTDLNKFVYVNSGSALTFTIPPNSSVAFPVGTEIHFLRYGTGEVSLAPGAGVTLQSEGSKRRINAQYQVVTIKKILTDTWALFGALKS